MKRVFKLINVRANDFTYRLEDAMQDKSIASTYLYEAGSNLLTLEGNEENIKNDFVTLKVCIHDINPEIEFEEIEIKDTYRKVLKLFNLDCANCANKVEGIAKRTFNHESISVDFATSRFIIETKDKELIDNLSERLQAVTKQVDRNIVVETKDKEQAKNNEKKKLHQRVCLIIGAVIFIAALILEYAIFPALKDDISSFVSLPWGGYITLQDGIMFVVSIAAYILLGYDVILSALSNIKNGRIFDEKFLMTLATIVAFCIKSFVEAVSVMLFYKIGELLQEIVVNKSRDSIAALVNIKPEKARMLYQEKEMEVDPSEIVPGDTIIVLPGERIPLDGVVIEGEGSLDTSALTGESKYTDIGPNMNIISGSVLIDGKLKIKVEKAYQDSMVGKILNLVENANVNKGKTEKVITRFAKWYTPVVCILAMVIVLYFLITHYLYPEELNLPFRTIQECVYPGMIFLVVSCPCALVISVPLSYFGAIGGASQKGILIKGSHFLEKLNSVGRVIFDKTGTLTKGQFKIKSVTSVKEGITEDEVFKYLAYCETVSNHPIARAIVNSFGKENIDLSKIELVSVNKRGAVVKVEDDVYAVGNLSKMEELKINVELIDEQGLTIFLIKNDEYIGNIVLEDEIREDAYDIIKALKIMNIKTAMLTGDNEVIAKDVATKLGIDEYYANLLPIDKVKKLRKLKKTLKNQSQIFVGDGVNDAPVLANVDVGVAMGAYGSDAAIEVADVVLMKDELLKVETVISIAKKTRRIVLENIVFSLAIKFIVLVIAVLLVDIPLMWEAVFADVGVSLIATMNSLRASNMGFKTLFTKNKESSKVTE